MATSLSPGPFQDVQNSVDSDKQHLLGDMSTKVDSYIHDMQETLPCPHPLSHATPVEGSLQPVGQLLEHMSETTVSTESHASGMAPCQQLSIPDTCQMLTSRWGIICQMWLFLGHGGMSMAMCQRPALELGRIWPKWLLLGHGGMSTDMCQMPASR